MPATPPPPATIRRNTPGTKLNILMTGDENDHRALGDLLPQLEAETGIKLEITSPALGALIEKTLQNLKADKSSFDLIEYLGFLTTQQVGGGYFEQLNKYIDDANETPPDWDFKDFIPAAMKNVGYYDMKAGAVGQGYGRLWHSRPAFGLGDLLLPQGPV